MWEKVSRNVLLGAAGGVLFLMIVLFSLEGFGSKDPAVREERGELFIGRVEHLLDPDGRPLDVVHYSLGGVPYSMVIDGEGGADRFIRYLEKVK